MKDSERVKRVTQALVGVRVGDRVKILRQVPGTMGEDRHLPDDVIGRIGYIEIFDDVNHPKTLDVMRSLDVDNKWWVRSCDVERV